MFFNLKNKLKLKKEITEDIKLKYFFSFSSNEKKSKIELSALTGQIPGVSFRIF